MALCVHTAHVFVRCVYILQTSPRLIQNKYRQPRYTRIPVLDVLDEEEQAVLKYAMTGS